LNYLFEFVLAHHSPLVGDPFLGVVPIVMPLPHFQAQLPDFAKEQKHERQ
jgi:hypothetical protein